MQTPENIILGYVIFTSTRVNSMFLKCKQKILYRCQEKSTKQRSLTYKFNFVKEKHFLELLKINAFYIEFRSLV